MGGMTWTSDWVEAGRAAEKRAATPCPTCGSPRTVGFSNLGIPVTACPVCAPLLVANKRKPVGDAWGYRES